MHVMSRNLPIDAVLFNLDGTLLHTSPGIGSALNCALTDHNIPSLSLDLMKTLIGGGSTLLVERALTLHGFSGWSHTHDKVLRHYEAHYRSVCHGLNGNLMALRPGVEATLDDLRQMGIKLGVVTSTERQFATPLLQRSGLSAWVDLVVDGDTLAQRKPHAAPLLHACEVLAVEPAHTLHVGGSANDAMAAQAAGMPMVCASRGYSADHALPRLQVIDDLDELPRLIGGPRSWRGSGSVRAPHQQDDSAGLWN
ncbi:MAG: HAD-IA family hydrolase [Dyella sp.]|nr:HAD-IA family hydrolase [Dyella sp.]